MVISCTLLIRRGEEGIGMHGQANPESCRMGEEKTRRVRGRVSSKGRSGNMMLVAGEVRGIYVRSRGGRGINIRSRGS